ncbi:adenosylcobinamide-GDP ribazoletransferase [Aurantimonas sp. MSK8Z-1]|uniref:adenosylcobinamide-GDP ribazoletransferase n=1 Tax=Mangrovibrevibacter kandeliae TaxID=2968473 RepID=UPI00222E4E8F|nr:adenosylcobinamide-GDP ribazoletransferase [Aurantimonas sp. MSK8Z-1]MCW4117145.1 adenosylcobinamide-GDP ribazoletransferase [Aurantimonas sp. MSK8Z-1]
MSLAPLLRSLAFLTRFSIGRARWPADHRLGADAPAFPLAGLIAALPAAAILLAASRLGLSPEITALTAIAAMIAATGGLHEDGLADVADGLGGQHPKDRALEIMKDSRIGTYGVLALLIVTLARIALLAALCARAPQSAAALYLAAAAGSRGAMAWLWSSLPPARAEGVAARLGQPTQSEGRIALVVGAGLVLLAALAAADPAGAVLGVALAAGATLWFRALIRRRLDGQTGDCVGATQQMAEVALLLGFVIAG